MNTQQQTANNTKQYTNQPKITEQQYKQATERRYYGDTISSIAIDLGITPQALSKRFIKDKVIPAKARAYPVSNILDNIHSPITENNINIYRKLTSREIAKIIDKLTLFSFKESLS